MDTKVTPSPFQQKVIEWVATGRGSAIVRARAGSGKTKLIELCLPVIAPHLSVQLFAFNKAIADELKARITKLATETGRDFRNVRAGTCQD
jgi:superfamily I DNA and RNA helicase